MVVIKFPDVDTQDEAIGLLASHFACHLFRSGEVIVPEAAVAMLAEQGFRFTVMGKPTDEQLAPFYSQTRGQMF